MCARPPDHESSAPPPLDAGSPGGLTAGEVARRLGVAVTTLRTWHQRYGLGPTGHAPGRHRRYTAHDLARLEIMRRLTAGGVPPAAAARRALSPNLAARSGYPGTGPDPLGSAVVGGEPGPLGVELPPGQSQSEQLPSDQLPYPRAWDGGGRAIAVGRAGPAARGLARATLRLDADSVATLVSNAITTSGVVRAWEDVLVPILSGIGIRHAATGGLIEVEHLLSGCVSAALAAVPRPPIGEPARILLTCADEEQHSLPLEALAAALAEIGVRVRMLGARVPSRALQDAVRRIGPAVVVIWAHARNHADPIQLRVLAALPARPALLMAAGPGWDDATLPAPVARPHTLSEAVAMLTQDYAHITAIDA